MVGPGSVSPGIVGGWGAGGGVVGGVAVQWAYKVKFAVWVTALAAVTCVPPVAAVNQPAKVYPARVGVAMALNALAKVPPVVTLPVWLAGAPPLPLKVTVRVVAAEPDHWAYRVKLDVCVMVLAAVT